MLLTNWLRLFASRFQRPFAPRTYRVRFETLFGSRRFFDFFPPHVDTGRRPQPAPVRQAALREKRFGPRQRLC